jgi:hypothetical protein
MSEIYATLTIIARNAAPIRQENYPRIWMVNSGGKAIKVHVAHDPASNPYVEGRFAA